MVSVAVSRAYQADVFWDLFCVWNLETYIIVVKGGVAILGRVSPSEVIWRGRKCHINLAEWMTFEKADAFLPLAHQSGLGVLHNKWWSHRRWSCRLCWNVSWWRSWPEGSDYNLHINIFRHKYKWFLLRCLGTGCGGHTQKCDGLLQLVALHRPAVVQVVWGESRLPGVQNVTKLLELMKAHHAWHVPLKSPSVKVHLCLF